MSRHPDRRGCGRSGDGAPGSYSFAKALDDLRATLKAAGVTRPVLVGHSFGGTLALKLLEADPQAVRAVVLVNSPLSYAAALRRISKRCREVYRRKKDLQGVAYLDMIAKMDTSSAQYAALAKSDATE